MNSNPMDSENYYPNPSFPSASSSGTVDVGEQRYLVVLAGESLPVDHPQPSGAQEVVVHAVANALASNREEAMGRAQEHLLSEALRPVTAFSAGQLKALARDLEECTLDPDTRVRLNQGKLRPEDYGLNADGTDPDDMDFADL